MQIWQILKKNKIINLFTLGAQQDWKQKAHYEQQKLQIWHNTICEEIKMLLFEYWCPGSTEVIELCFRLSEKNKQKVKLNPHHDINKNETYLGIIGQWISRCFPIGELVQDYTCIIMIIWSWTIWIKETNQLRNICLWSQRVNLR